MIGVDGWQDLATEAGEVSGVEDVIDEQTAGVARTGMPCGLDTVTGCGVDQC